MAVAFYVRRPGYCWQRVSELQAQSLLCWFDLQLLGLAYDLALECEGWAVMAVQE